MGLLQTQNATIDTDYLTMLTIEDAKTNDDKDTNAVVAYVRSDNVSHIVVLYTSQDMEEAQAYLASLERRWQIDLWGIEHTHLTDEQVKALMPRFWDGIAKRNDKKLAKLGEEEY